MPPRSLDARIRVLAFLFASCTLTFIACGRLPLATGDGGTADAKQGQAGTRGGTTGAGGRAGSTGSGAAGTFNGTGIAGTTGLAGTTGIAGTWGGSAGTWGFAGTTGVAGTWGFAGSTGIAGTGGFVCKPNTSTCLDQYVLNICRPDGTWSLPFKCERGCFNGACRDCSFGETRCASQTLAQTCDPTGTWTTLSMCPNGCIDGQCAGKCQPGSSDCFSGGTARTCKADGVWGDPTFCANGCVGGTGCLECNPFEGTCLTANTGRMCQPDGKWGASFKCGTSCENGRCIDCNPGEQQCVDDKNARVCTDNGTWGAAMACEFSCFNDSCRSCKPGSTQCPSGDSIQLCNSDGEWGDWITCANVCTAGVCTTNPKKVFVTSTTYKGGEIGGLVGADAKCQQRAAAANLPGTYRAWLSDFNGSPVTRFNLNGGPYLLVNGGVVANNWTGLTSGTLRHSINITELGGAASTVPGPDCGVPIVWTATSSDGNAGDLTYACGDWTDSTGFSAWWGTTSSQSLWSQGCIGGNSAATGCGASAPLFCFQQ